VPGLQCDETRKDFTMSKPAFPHESPKEIHAGMSLLKYYAGQALTGVIANHEFYISAIETAKERDIKVTKWIAMGCFEFAEAMIEEANER